jgi:hypothetical protein
MLLARCGAQVGNPCFSAEPYPPQRQGQEYPVPSLVQAIPKRSRVRSHRSILEGPRHSHGGVMFCAFRRPRKQATPAPRDRHYGGCRPGPDKPALDVPEVPVSRDLAASRCSRQHIQFIQSNHEAHVDNLLITSRDRSHRLQTRLRALRVVTPPARHLWSSHRQATRRMPVRGCHARVYGCLGAESGSSRKGGGPSSYKRQKLPVFPKYPS